jgi:protein-arginine kinase activator protein McsA
MKERHAIVTSQKIREMKRIIEEEEFETRALIRQQLNYAMRLECSD